MLGNTGQDAHISRGLLFIGTSRSSLLYAVAVLSVRRPKFSYNVWLNSSAVYAETVTLFGFQPNGFPQNTVSLSVAGVGADGATTYVEEILLTAVVYADSDGTNTAVNSVQTLHGIFFF